MAYKFQLGSAILSGSTKFEEAVEVAGGLKLSGVGDTALDVSTDSFLFRDGDGTMKRDTMADYATAIAGDGLAASSGVLSLDIDELTALGGTGVDQADHFVFSDGGTEKKITFSNLEDAIFANVSGDATVAAGGALTIANTAVETAMIADDAVTPAKMSLFDDSLAAIDTHILIADGSDYSSFALSGDVTMTNAGVVSIGATKVTDAMLNDDVATGLAGVGLGASGGVLAVQVSGAIVLDNDKLGLSGSVAGDGLKFIGGAESLSSLEVDLEGLPAGDVAVANDSFAFIDADGGLSKKESIGDLMTAVAGAGLGASSGVLAVGAETNGGIAVLANGVKMDLADLSAAAVDASADSIAILDATDSSTKLESIADLAVAMAGAGIGPNAGTFILDLNELSAAAVDVANDSIAIVDANDSNGSKKESIADLMTAVAGNGLSAASGVLAVDIITDGGLDANAAASGKLGLDLNDLAAAAVDVANDSFAIIDANDSNITRKESVADLVSAVAGAGLTATSGVLSVTGNNVNARADGESLTEGYNIFADLSSDATVTMPSSAGSSVGDVIVVKAKGLNSAKIVINSQATAQKIDGEDSVEIESPFGAVTMVYVAADDWRIV